MKTEYIAFGKKHFFQKKGLSILKAEERAGNLKIIKKEIEETGTGDYNTYKWKMIVTFECTLNSTYIVDLENKLRAEDNSLTTWVEQVEKNN